MRRTVFEVRVEALAALGWFVCSQLGGDAVNAPQDLR